MAKVKIWISPKNMEPETYKFNIVTSVKYYWVYLFQVILPVMHRRYIKKIYTIKSTIFNYSLNKFLSYDVLMKLISCS